MQVDEAVEGGAMNWYLSGGFLRARIFSKIDEHVPLAIEAYEALLHYTKELKLTIFEARTRIYQPAPATHALWASLLELTLALACWQDEVRVAKQMVGLLKQKLAQQAGKVETAP